MSHFETESVLVPVYRRTMTSSQEALRAHILSLSHASDFGAACQEWRLSSVYVTDDWDHCPCGMEIKEHCEIRNVETGRHTFVGNVCINRFLDLGTAPIFAGLRRIRDDIGANANLPLIEYAEKKGFLFPKEIGFLVDTTRKRNLSPKQRGWKEKINRRILEGIVVRALPGRS